MSGNFQDKFIKWAGIKAAPVLPIQAAAGILNCKKELERGGWTTDQETYKKTLRLCDIIAKGLYCLETFDKTGNPFSKKAMDKITIELLSLPAEDFARFAAHGYRPRSLTRPVDTKSEDYSEKLLGHDKKNIDAFLKRAKHLSATTDISLANITQAIEGVLNRRSYPELIEDTVKTSFWDLQICLNDNAHPSMLSRNTDMFTPKDGPRNHYEMFVLGMIYLKANNLIDPVSNRPRTAFGMWAAAFVGVAHDKIMDLPEDAVYGNMKKDMEAVSKLPKIYTLTGEKFLGLMRFYTSHNKEKLTLDQQAKLESYICSAYECRVNEQLEAAGFKQMYAETPGLIEQTMEKSRVFLGEYSKPAPQDVANSFIEKVSVKFSGNKRERLINDFNAARAAIPDCMEEQVVLYYRETEEFKKLRQLIFKNHKTRSGADGPKKACLKKRARDYRESFIQIGMRPEAVDQMAEDGKIPNDENGVQYPLTVEHINDRDYGGTNHADNLIPAAKHVNLGKDWLKKIQLDNTENVEKGAWILTWVPKRLKNGDFPPVLPVPLAPSCS